VKIILLPAMFALALTSCIAVVKRDNHNPPPHEPVRNNPPPPPQPPPPQPEWQGWESSLQLKYDAALDDCFEASRKVMGIMRFSESDLDKKTGVINGQFGSTYIRCSMYRRNHHTFLTFHVRVKDRRADARTPGDIATRCHQQVGQRVKEQGRKTD
jgi:hypothetical protein